MQIRILLPALVLGVCLAVAAGLPAPAADSADEATIKKLIEQLGADSFADREKASKALNAIGVPALKALQQASKSSDAEVRKRASDLVSKIEKRLESDRVLAAKMVHLVYKDTPITEAVEDFRKKSGYSIVLHDPSNTLKDKKITLDTGKTTFWDALDQFCSAAGLVEGDPNTAAAPPPRPAGRGVRAVPGGAVPVPAKKAVRRVKPLKAAPAPAPVPQPAPVPPAKKGAALPKNGAQRAVAVAQIAVAFAAQNPAVQPVPVPLPAIQPAVPGGFGRVAAPGWAPVQPGQITLLPGKSPKVPTDASSSIRVRLADRTRYKLTVGEKEIGVVLEISPEPRLRWQQAMSVLIDKALDNNDQTLRQATDVNNNAANPAIGRVIILPGGGVVMPGGVGPGGGWFPPSNNGVNNYISIRLLKGEKETKSLKELSGTISAQMLSDPEKVLVLDNVMKATGKSVKGKSSGMIQINSVTTQPDGTIQINFEFEPPTGITPEMVAQGKGANAAANRAVARQIVIQNGVVIVNSVSGINGYGLTLEDSKGNTLPATIRLNLTRVNRAAGGRLKREFSATYKPEKGAAAEPARMVFTGRRTISVAVPFKLTNVELK